MTTIWNWIRIYIRGISDILFGIWLAVSGVAYSTVGSNSYIRRFIKAELVVIGIAFLTIITGLYFQQTFLVIMGGVASAIAFIICWKSSDLAIDIIKNIAGNVPLIGENIITPITTPLSDTLKSLLNPLKIISLFFAFFSAVVWVKGIGFLTFHDGVAWALLVLFIAIFWVWAGTKVTIAGWVLAVMLTWVYIGNFFFPVQVQGTLDYIESITFKRTIATDHQSMGAKLITIPPDTPLYDYGYGGFSFTGNLTGPQPIVAKLIDRKVDPNTKEAMYYTVFPIPGRKDLYVGGRKIWVVARTSAPAPDEQQGDAPQSGVKTVNLVLGKKYEYTLKTGEQTPWMKVPSNAVCYIDQLNDNTNGWSLYYDDGTIVHFKAGDNKGSPPKTDTALKINANGPVQKFIVRPVPLKIIEKTV